jgi:site-specific DNA-methyltransferase (adenine-specific)
LLPKELFESKETTFLDPVTKSGVFLREIAKRLMDGLEKEIPDKQERINHIFKNQIFGIAITELTSLLARRSLYCSKTANGKYSICEEFDNKQGNVLFDRVEHAWSGGNCKFCGASEANYSRGGELETYAYQFIHTENPEELFNMKFDVIVGNPPYQLDDGGFGKSAKPIYHKFIEQAKKLAPSSLAMIIPARWYNGGKGLDQFRNSMLTDKRISKIHDFPDTKDCFPGLNIRGGVCFFLWEKDYIGDCEVSTHKKENITSVMKRPLLEDGFNIFVRYNEAIQILHKVTKFQERAFNEIVSARKPFGLATNFNDFAKRSGVINDIYLFRFGENGYINQEQVARNNEWTNQWKVLVPKASPGDDSYPHLILSKPLISPPKTCCTETYIVVGPVKNESQAKNIANYMKTSFFRFMVLLAKSTQDVTKKTYIFAPMQDFNEKWNDKKLYQKYKITTEDQTFINTLIRPMELDGE